MLTTDRQKLYKVFLKYHHWRFSTGLLEEQYSIVKRSSSLKREIFGWNLNTIYYQLYGLSNAGFFLEVNILVLTTLNSVRVDRRKLGWF